MEKIHIIKFLPYFPPHRGGLESHVQERSQRWIKKGYGNVINVTTPMGQESIIRGEKLLMDGFEKIVHHDRIIGYKSEGYQVIILDAFDIIPGFPFPKFWTSYFWSTIYYLNAQVQHYKNEHTIVHTHTRFFLTSLLGGLYAKCMRLKWMHIEHGTDFVQLASKYKTWIAYRYDQTIGRCIFKSADVVVAISVGCQKFANTFTDKNIQVIHRGMGFSQTQSNLLAKEARISKGSITLGFAGRIVALKGLDLLIAAFSHIHDKYPTLTLEIVGEGDQLNQLQNTVKQIGLQHKILFLGAKDRTYIANDFLPHIDIVVNPSYQEGLPTSVLEGLLSKCVVVATRVGGTPEISHHKDLILINKGDIADLQKGLEYAIQNYKKLYGLSYEHVKEKFDWDKSIERYYKVCDSMF